MQRDLLLASRIFRVERLTYESNGNSLSRDVIRHPGSVAIVPRLDGGRVCLIRNRRVSVDQTLVEIPAGTMEPPEPPLACAHRELQEETGYRAGSMRQITEILPAPGILDERMFLFEAVDLTAGAHARELGEEIENLEVSLTAALDMIHNGQIIDAKTIIGLLLVARSR